MGRPPSNGGPSFRFNPAEIAEMESILQAHKTAMPAREVLVTLAEKFSNSEERKGKIEVQMKQVWNWFQNRRYAIRAKAGKSPGKLNITQMAPRDDPTMVKGIPQPTQPHVASSAIRSLPQVQQHPTVPSASVRTFPQAPQNPVAYSVQSAGRVTDNSQMEYEAKSARDGAWYDVSTFLSHRSIDTGDPEVLVRFAGFGAEEDEWVNVRKNVRQRSLPCEASECVAVLPADLILCFQEGKEQALYFDAHVLDAQRRRHDVRGCRCRFLVRYDHDQSEEIVALRKICRRPETDYRLQQLHAVNEAQNKNNIHTVSTLRVYPPAEVQPKQLKVEPPVVAAETPQKRQKVESAVPAPPLENPAVVAAQASDVPLDQQKVQPVLPAPAPLDQPSVEVQKVAVPSNEVPLEMQKVQPVMPDPSSLEPQVVGPDVPPSAETSPPLAATETPVEPPPQGEAEKQEEPSSSVDVQTEMPQVQPESSLEVKETKDEVPVELPEVQPEMENKAEVQPAIETKTEVPVELPEVQPASELVGLETKAEVPPELPQVQPESALEEMETKAEVPEELREVQPASEPEAMETKAEVLAEMPQVQPESEVKPIETKAEVPEEVPEVQPASALETKVEVPSELPDVQPVSAPVVVETKAEVPEELPKEQPDAMETKPDEPVITNDSNEAEVAMEMEAVEPVAPVSTEYSNVVEAEIDQPKDSEVMDIDDTNVKEDEHANVVDNGSKDKVGDSDLQSDMVKDDMEEV